MKIICHFSCGAASAIATKLAIEKHGEVTIVYSNTHSEHPDNERFLKDCERFFGRKVTVVQSKTFGNIYEVFTKRRFLSSPHGAPCTSELKRIPAQELWNFGDIEVFGYTADEKHRLERFRAQNDERIIECPLIDAGLTKQDCLDALTKAGIALPAMYLLGFRNNNCIGCVKARDSISYWKRVRKHFPEQFAKMAALERELDTTINRRTKNGVRSRVFLDEIEPGDPKGEDKSVSCGILCGQQ